MVHDLSDLKLMTRNVAMANMPIPLYMPELIENFKKACANQQTLRGCSQKSDGEKAYYNRLITLAPGTAETISNELVKMAAPPGVTCDPKVKDAETECKKRGIDLQNTYLYHCTSKSKGGVCMSWQDKYGATAWTRIVNGNTVNHIGNSDQTPFTIFTLKPKCPPSLSLEDASAAKQYGTCTI